MSGQMMCLCVRCGQAAHPPEQCRCVKAIEYHENGSIKRIEYHDPYPPAPLPSVAPPWWPMPWLPGHDVISGTSIETNIPGVLVTQTWCGVNS